MKEHIAEKLLEIGALSLNPTSPFTWASGLRSPIYCDNRLTMSVPSVRKEIACQLTKLIEENFPEIDLIAGTATAGIPHAAWVSELLELPMCYVRSKAKEHGKGNQIEGRVKAGQKVVVIEDLISTGGSVIKAVEALREAGCFVVGVVSIFTYELERGRERLENENIPVHSATDYTTLLQVASSKGYIKSDDIQTLLKWRNNPSEWSSQFLN